jgi:hypothetical protein
MGEARLVSLKKPGGDCSPGLIGRSVVMRRVEATIPDLRRSDIVAEFVAPS